MVNKISPTKNPVSFSPEWANKKMKVTVMAYWEGDSNADYIGTECTLTGNHAFLYAGKGECYEVILKDDIKAWFSVQCLTPVE